MFSHDSRTAREDLAAQRDAVVAKHTSCSFAALSVCSASLGMLKSCGTDFPSKSFMGFDQGAPAHRTQPTDAHHKGGSSVRRVGLAPDCAKDAGVHTKRHLSMRANGYRVYHAA